MRISLKKAFWFNFLGQSPNWFKIILVFFLIINLLFFFISPFIAGWLIVIEFIFTLAMSLKCYPLLSGGLIAIEALIIGITSHEHVFKEISENLEVLLLLIFMVAGINFMKQLLLFIFTRLLLSIYSKRKLSLAFCFSAAFLSAFLDALTVIAMLINVTTSLFNIYKQISFGNENSIINNSNNYTNDVKALEEFRSFLRSIIMHTGIGTALGGVMTMVGEPQNLIIAQIAGWNFNEFFFHIAPISLPVLACGLLTCWLLEKFSLFSYGAELPIQIRNILKEFYNKNYRHLNIQDKVQLIIQGIICIWLISALALHIAEVSLIGLSVIIFITSLTGINNEHTIGQAFTESLPFAALLILFFTIISVIKDQRLFMPLIENIFKISPNIQPMIFYIFNGLFSSISDNVFIGTIYINEAKAALERNIINIQQFELLAVAINAGTNLPSVATPNGQAAFLFILTSALAPMIHLSYNRMFWMSLPYTIVLTVVGLIFVIMLTPITRWMMQVGIIISH